MELEQNKRTSKIPLSPGLGWRHVQTLLLIIGETISLSLNVNFSVGIVAMRDNTTNNAIFPTYNWDQPTATMMLGSFLYGYSIAILPAGYLARKKSPLNVLTFGVLCSSVVSMFIPWFADVGYGAVIAARVVVGFCQGGVYTSIVTIIARWIPLSERGRLGATVLNGIPLGSVAGMSVSGLLAGSKLGWPSVFYFFGVLGIIWSLLFYWLGADYPSDHPKISSKELEYINASLEGNLSSCADCKSAKVPWGQIIKSVPFWAVVLTRCGDTWGFYTFATQLPTYLTNGLNYDVQESGTVSALPYVATWLLGFPISFISDYALKKGAPTAYVRKTCAIIGFWIPALCMLILATVTTTDRKFIVAILVVAIGFKSATSCGHQLNFMELAPNYVSVLSSIGGLSGTSCSLGIPYLFKSVITDPKDVEQWKMVFFVTAVIYFFSNLFFLIFGRCEVQAWNNPINQVKN